MNIKVKRTRKQYPTSRFIGMRLLILCIAFALQSTAKPVRIITLNGALTETVDALGYGSKIVAVDVTSVYPAYIAKIPKVSKNRSVSLEGLLSFKPDLILAPEEVLSKEMQAQLKTLKIKYVIFSQEYTVKGTISFIQKVAVALEEEAKGQLLAKQLEARVNKALAQIKAAPAKSPKVLFIYARGTGTMSVAGKGGHIDAIIKLAGGRNAIQEFNDFKPYTTESLVKANPDVILMFDFGMSSLGGKDAILKMPGIGLTNAGKNKKIVAMDGNLLTNFSVRLDKAITELHQKMLL